LANGGLAYTRFSDCRRGADPSIELLASDGRPVEVLRDFNERGDFWLTKPSVSADGAWISFSAESVVLGPGTGRYVAAADGTRAHRVGAGGSAAWSPDGQWLAFADGDPEANSDIWIVRRDASDRRRITSTPAHEVVIAWLAASP
jgi:Tol biopolymer transport system component